MSKTLAELEALAGTRLVERSSAGRRGVQGLTAAGEQLLAHALRVLEAIEASAQAVAPVSGERPERLRIGALPSLAGSLLPEALATLRARWPALAGAGQDGRQRGAARRTARRRTRSGGRPHERSPADERPELRAAAHRAAGVRSAAGASVGAARGLGARRARLSAGGLQRRHHPAAQHRELLLGAGPGAAGQRPADAGCIGGARAGRVLRCRLDHAARRGAGRVARRPARALAHRHAGHRGAGRPAGAQRGRSFGSAQRDGRPAARTGAARQRKTSNRRSRAGAVHLDGEFAP